MTQGDLIEHAIIKRVSEDCNESLSKLCGLCEQGDENTEIEQFTIQRLSDGSFRSIVKGWRVGGNGDPFSFVWFDSAPRVSTLLGIIEAGLSIGNFGAVPDSYAKPRRAETSIRRPGRDHYE